MRDTRIASERRLSTHSAYTLGGESISMGMSRDESNLTLISNLRNAELKKWIYFFENWFYW